MGCQTFPKLDTASAHSEKVAVLVFSISAALVA